MAFGWWWEKTHRHLRNLLENHRKTHLNFHWLWKILEIPLSLYYSGKFGGTRHLQTHQYFPKVRRTKEQLETIQHIQWFCTPLLWGSISHSLSNVVNPKISQNHHNGLYGPSPKMVEFMALVLPHDSNCPFFYHCWLYMQYESLLFTTTSHY